MSEDAKTRYEMAFSSGDEKGMSDAVREAAEAMIDSWPRLEPGDDVDGLTVRKFIPNTDSIKASFKSHTSMGLRAVPIDIFTLDDPSPTQLSEAISESKEINPLIVAVDGHQDGPAYIIEGSHRIDALRTLGVKSIPALVVYDDDTEHVVRDGRGDVIPLSKRFPISNNGKDPEVENEPFIVALPDGGMLFKVKISVPHSALLDWDKPIKEQSAAVQTAIRSNIEENQWLEVSQRTGEDFYRFHLDGFQNAKAASARLDQWGIKGIRYLDQGSRNNGEGTRNLVIFDEKLVTKVPSSIVHTREEEIRMQEYVSIKTDGKQECRGEEEKDDDVALERESGPLRTNSTSQRAWEGRGI